MKLRLQITKDPEIRFVSHLDYLRAIERSLRRSELPVAYSEGFNPHIKFSLASALGVGIVSYAEFVEIEMAEPVEPEQAVLSLRSSLPRGIRILAADAVANNENALMAEATLFDYRVTLQSIADHLDEKITKFNSSQTLLFKKSAPKRREGFKEVDVKKYVDKVNYEVTGNKVILTFSIKNFNEGSFKAVDVLKVLELNTENADVERLAIWRKNHEPMLIGGIK
ncbi:MAG: TIGR03936 family radical SAM-associated protein [Acidaminococcaceae bacterium]|nr:TIGR03936 family radical SAM-associated protein [Acidaminococcaceae bacterium]MDO4935248.1 TIGR03936 family radical SAM-associated protein [Phascolarctobacterium sp.]